MWNQIDYDYLVHDVVCDFKQLSFKRDPLKNERFSEIRF